MSGGRRGRHYRGAKSSSRTKHRTLPNGVERSDPFIGQGERELDGAKPSNAMDLEGISGGFPSTGSLRGFPGGRTDDSAEASGNRTLAWELDEFRIASCIGTGTLKSEADPSFARAHGFRVPAWARNEGDSHSIRQTALPDLSPPFSPPFRSRSAARRRRDNCIGGP